MSKKSSELDLTEATEMDLLSPERQTRFQVNRVNDAENGNHHEVKLRLEPDRQNNDDEDHDLHSFTDRTKLNSADYGKSLR